MTFLPIVVFRAQLKVGQGDGHFGQRDEEQQPHHQQEPKDVVVRRAKPNGRHDEIQFNGHGACRIGRCVDGAIGKTC